MIFIRQDQNGNLIIDFSDEPNFDIATDGIDLRLGLTVKQILPTSLVIEDTGQLGPVIKYAKSVLETQGRRLVVDSALLARLQKFDEEEKLVQEIAEGKIRRVNFTKTPQTAPLTIKRKLLPHQLKGLNHGLTVHNAANFSVPGSGKTTTALCIYAMLRNEKTVDLMLVIGPASSFRPWEDEFHYTFARKPHVIRLIGSIGQRTRLLMGVDRADFILCTYHMAYRERENLRKLLRKKKVFLVLDESHNIKNINLGPWAQTALDLAPLAVRRLILTGTPMPHSLRDLWSQFTFLWPSEILLRDRLDFDQRVQSSENILETIKQDLTPFFIRTKKSDLKLPSPKIQFVKIPRGSVPKRQKLILQLLELRVLNEARSLGLGKVDMATLKQWRRARTIRLMQAASNPALLSTPNLELGDSGTPLDVEPVLANLLKSYESQEIPAKVQWVISQATELVSKGRKVVIWASFIKNLVLLEHLLKEFNPLLIHGGVPAYEEDTDPEFENREGNIREFTTNPDRWILLANPGACSESISLHYACQDAIYLERTFNCGQFLQSMDRINRVGMPPGTRAHYYIPLIPCAIERVLNRRLSERQQALYRLLDDDMPVLGYDDDADLLEHEDDLEEIFSEVLREIKKDVAS